MYGLAAVMYQAAEAEDNTAQEVSEKISRLEYENKHLREVLQLSYPTVEEQTRAPTESSEKEGSSAHNSPNNMWSKIDRI